MTQYKMLTIMAIATAATIAPASAAVVDGINWADEMVDCSDGVTNYGLYGTRERLTDNPEWVEGPPDADQNGNGYFFDTDPPVDRDTLAGWNGQAPQHSYFTVYFDTAINDLPGDDLVIVSAGNVNGEENVWASSTDVEDDYVLIGTIGFLGSNPGYFAELWIDFEGLVDDVHYVKITRPFASPAPQSGRWIDAVGGVVPEPATLSLLGLGGLGLIRRKRKAM
jgi:hypothetical protein